MQFLTAGAGKLVTERQLFGVLGAPLGARAKSSGVRQCAGHLNAGDGVRNRLSLFVRTKEGVAVTVLPCMDTTEIVAAGRHAHRRDSWNDTSSPDVQAGAGQRPVSPKTRFGS